MRRVAKRICALSSCRGSRTCVFAPWSTWRHRGCDEQPSLFRLVSTNLAQQLIQRCAEVALEPGPGATAQSCESIVVPIALVDIILAQAADRSFARFNLQPGSQLRVSAKKIPVKPYSYCANLSVAAHVDLSNLFSVLCWRGVPFSRFLAKTLGRAGAERERPAPIDSTLSPCWFANSNGL